MVVEVELGVELEVALLAEARRPAGLEIAVPLYIQAVDTSDTI